MPSTSLLVQSGGIGLISGDIFQNTNLPATGVYLKNPLSGLVVHIGLPGLSGGVNTVASGGLNDAIPLEAGERMFVPKGRLVSGLETIRLLAPATSSGTVIFWTWDLPL